MPAPRVDSRALARAFRVALWVVAGAVAVAVVIGVVFAGSPDRIPAGVSVAGIKLSGLTPGQAEEILSDLSARYATVPVVLTAGG